MLKHQSITDHIRETNLHFARTVAMGIFVAVLLVVLIVRSFYLQVVEYSTYTTSSEKNRIRVLPIAPTRGLIYDTNGVLLADNQSVYSLEIIPDQVKNLTQVINQLAQIIPITERDRKRFNEVRRKKRRFNKVPLKVRLTEQERAKFAVNRHHFPGVSIEARLVRNYPFGESLVHVLGYVSRINDRDLLKIDQKNYQATRTIGKLGIERSYEKVLHGKIGYQEVEIDALGRVVRVLRKEPPVPGSNLHLHIDGELQVTAEKALDGRRGAVVAIKPESGGILAMVSAPGYDPNLFVTGIDQTSYSALLQSRDLPLFNRVLQGKYPPGSTIKPLIGLLGLDTQVITRQFRFFDRGWYTLEGEEHRYRDWRKLGRGWVDLDYAIYDSCDTYFYELAFRLGIDRISTAMQAMGFGAKTGVDVYEEVAALMPSRQWKREERRLAWYPGETLITGIGQGFWTTTPLQLANITASIANYGVRYVPKIVDQIEFADGSRKKLIPALAALQYTNKNMSNLLYIRDTMKHVVSKGTAKAPFLEAPYQSAGKTGTAQLRAIAQDEEYDEEKIDERHRDNAMYVGFAPFEQAKISVSVVVENAGGGSKSAAPVARKVMDHYLVTKGQLDEALASAQQQGG